jgi:uncharacterized protein
VSGFLLDVNVLIALIDPAHVQHDAAHDWFGREGERSWATCPITENAVFRIIGNPRYPNSPGPPASLAALMRQMCALPGHQFWPDDVSLLDDRSFDLSRLLSSGQVTDSYLLALARAHGGYLATFDRRLVTEAVPEGAQSLHLIT